MKRPLLAALGLLCTVHVARAIAGDVPVDGRVVILRQTPSGREVLQLLVRDADLPVPTRRSTGDPTMRGSSGATLEVFSGDGTTTAIPVPGGMPGWKARDVRGQVTSFRYGNPLAPGGATSVKVLVLRRGKDLLVVGRDTGLPLTLPLGRLGIRLTMGDVRVCTLFDESTVVQDRPGLFVARRAVAAAAPDCSDASLSGVPPTTTSTTTTTSSSTTTTSTSTTTSTLPGTLFGNAVEFPAASDHTPGFLLGSQIQIPVAVTVTHLSVIAKAAGPRVLLGLYRNSGGMPTTLVVGTAPTVLSAGAVEIPVPPTPLTAGRYWLMALYESPASVGIDTSNASAVAMYDLRDFAAGLPSSIAFPTSVFGQRYNYYLRALN
jgi:hypothetical protein